MADPPCYDLGMQNHKYDGCKEATNEGKESRSEVISNRSGESNQAEQRLKPRQESQVSRFMFHGGETEEHRLVWPDEEGEAA